MKKIVNKIIVGTIFLNVLLSPAFVVNAEINKTTQSAINEESTIISSSEKSTIDQTFESTGYSETSTQMEKETSSTIEKNESTEKIHEKNKSLEKEQNKKEVLQLKDTQNEIYVTVILQSTQLWKTEIGQDDPEVREDLYLKTFISKEKKIVDNQEYYSLYELKDNKTDFIGYVLSDAIQKADGEQGIYQSFNKYVAISKESSTTYRNFSWDELYDGKAIKDKTFYAKGKYNHINGSTYLSLFDSNDKWYGYIDSKNVTEADGRQGIYQSYWKYVTITSKNYYTYNDFNWVERESSRNIQGTTYQARGKYQHFNGSTYLSLYDGEGKWCGYINEKATKVGANRQGAYQSHNKYVTITSKNYLTYRNFSWDVLGKTSDYYGKTFYAKGKYQHFNGSTYLSLFDSNDKWYGYVNESATKLANGRQGIYQSYGKYVTVTNNNYPTYSNFSWNQLNGTRNMYSKTYHAKGKYQHFNGSTYLSLFDSNGKWYGYVNERATAVGEGKQGIYQSFNRHIIIRSKNYDMWRNFNWDVKQPSANQYSKGLIAKGKYVHFNGAVYYSIYDGLGNWQGYINEGGVTVVTQFDIPTTYYSQMSIGALYGCAATSLYTSLRAKGYAGNISLVNFVDGLPLSKNNPDEGQIGDPWGHTPFVRVISPIGLNKYARRYTSNTEIITGSSIDRMITEINSGNMVMFWGEFDMRDPNVYKNPQHVLMAKGYKVVNGREYIFIQDPGLYSSTDYRSYRWYEKSSLDHYLSTKYRKMLVIR
ncbi:MULTISPECIES: C39 family peptidase [Vagococcus]|uniref:Peptidase C39-like domain-containing protein n=1 Tax=Vagococcus fluvialis bH819 TaxID=1255619 RepID=A0A1X6WML6_9ENTE|nr:MULTISPECIES: C39 family peptidase [Vagococcus]SLM84916.1 hypothetical protein FM121_02395 [Vagococcus fluvialis bH819]